MNQTIEDVYAEADRLARVHRLTRDLSPQDQEDIAQEAVANYLGAFAPGRAPDNAAAWLEVAIRNEASDFLRRLRRRREREVVPAADHDGDVEEVLVRQRAPRTPSLFPVRADLLKRVMGLLPPDAAEVLRLRFVEDLDAASVATQLAIERATVDHRVARAKRLLRAALLARSDLAEELRRTHPRLY